MNIDICSLVKTVIEENLQEILKLRQTGRLKSDNSFVSDGDILSEKVIINAIQSVGEDILVISEETAVDLSDIDNHEIIVTVDPIDGTENFISGLKEWGVGVSVYQNNRHAQSMIMLPELGISLKSGDTIERIAHSRICGLSSYMTPKDFEFLGKGYEYRIMGCCMYNMYNVIRGCYKRFDHLKGCYSWDILPGLNLALEHGLHPVVDGEEYCGQFLLPGIKYTFSINNE